MERAKHVPLPFATHPTAGESDVGPTAVKIAGKRKGMVTEEPPGRADRHATRLLPSKESRAHHFDGLFRRPLGCAVEPQDKHG